jgi:hypothetical protein
MKGNFHVRFGKGIIIIKYMVFIILVHPFILAGQIATAYYFAHFLIILPLFGFIHNILSIISNN